MATNHNKDSSAFSGKAGVTLVELILVIGMMIILGAISVPVLQSFQVANDLDMAVNNITQDLRRAQSLSEAMMGDISWGVYIQPGSIILFKGLSYLGRDVSFDELSDMPTDVTPSGIKEIVFSKFTGEPQTTGDIVLITTNEVRTITVGKKGIVSY